MEATPTQINACTFHAEVQNRLVCCMAGWDWESVERRALERHPPRQRKDASPFLNPEPVDPALKKIAVDLAKEQLPKREPKRSRKTLP